MDMLLTLTASESKRLIAKGVAALPMVQEHMKRGRVAIPNGSTNAYVAEELLGIEMDKAYFPCGVSTIGRLCRTPDDRIRTIIIRDGEVIERSYDTEDLADLREFYREFGPNDLFIKGANAIDADGNAGIFLANPFGGNLLAIYPNMVAQKIPMLIPVGLEKMVASVPKAARASKGVGSYDISYGTPCGYITIPNGIIFTEIEAIKTLCGADAVHLGSGGVGGNEGAVTLCINGDGEQLKELCRILRTVKGEPPLENRKYDCRQCKHGCRYPYLPQK